MLLNRITISNYFEENKYIFLHFAGLIILLAILEQLQIIQIAKILQYDAWWYKSIVENGYVFKENEQCNLAFYPAFPFIWKFLHVSYLGISIVNLCITILTLTIINSTFKIGYKKTLIFGTLPSMFFCFMPYSESLFMFLCTVFLSGYYLKKTWLIVLGLFLASFTRSVAPIFMVALVFVELTSVSFSIKNILTSLKKILLFSFSVILGICSVAIVQNYYTGKWFYFFEVQKYWGKTISLPKIPFTTWDGNRLLWLDGIAFTVGVLSFIFICNILYKWLTNKIITNQYSKIFSFSIVYLFLVSLITILSSIVDKGTQTTSIYSLNRYVLAVPFMFPLIAHIFSETTKFQKNWMSILGFILFLGIFISHNNPLNIIVIIIYIGIYYWLAIKQQFERFWYIPYASNVIMLTLLLSWFTKGMWIG